MIAIGYLDRPQHREQIVMNRFHVSGEAMTACKKRSTLPGLGRFLEERKVFEARRRNGCRPE